MQNLAAKWRFGGRKDHLFTAWLGFSNASGRGGKRLSFPKTETKKPGLGLVVEAKGVKHVDVGETNLQRIHVYNRNCVKKIFHSGFLPSAVFQ